MIIGVDLGNYAVKTSEKVSFLSKITQEESFLNEDEININGTDYFIGRGEFSTDWVKSKKNNTLPMLFTAIYKSSNETVNQIVVGLPIQQYKNDKDKIKRLIENNRCANVNGKQIVISDVAVAPEGASAIYNMDSNLKESIGKKQLIIVDIGGRTTDITMFFNNKIQDIKTIPVGALNIYQDIVNYINTKYNQSFILEDGEIVLEDGLFLDGEHKDISFITPILKKYFNSIYKELQLKFNLNKGFVYLTGGGSNIYKIAFKNRLNNVIMSKEPVFDNVIGFERVGEQLWL